MQAILDVAGKYLMLKRCSEWNFNNFHHPPLAHYKKQNDDTRVSAVIPIDKTD